MNRLIYAAACSVLALLLTACSPFGDDPSKGSIMTPDEVRSQISDLYEASAQLVGADGWEIQGLWAGCPAEDGQKRARWNFSATRTAALPSSPIDIITQAQNVWESLGLDVKVEQDTNLTPPRYVLSDPPYLTGTRDDGSHTQLSVGDSFVYFDAISACVPGDIGELNARRSTG